MMARPFRLIALILFWLWSSAAVAQTASTGQPLLTSEQLDQLLAPIALYPDPLLAQVLMASTYPLEVVQADRWAKAHRGWRGDPMTSALAKETWDESVKSLVQVPTVLAMMSDKLDWTQKVGDAMLAQQADVMDSVQRLRTRARANGKLESGNQQTVSVKSDDQKQYIAIEPASPTEIYVPYYQPAVVYGEWPYPAYPPLYFPPPPGYVTASALASGVAFGAGVAAGYAIWGTCNWAAHNINVVSNRSVSIANFNRSDANFTRWEHNPDHRHGVRYNNDAVRQKYGRTNLQPGKDMRQDFRGRDGERVLDPERKRPEAGEREERANLGERERQGEREVNRGEGPRSGVNRTTARPREGAFEQSYSGRATRAHSERGRQSYAGGAATRHAGSRGRR